MDIKLAHMNGNIIRSRTLIHVYSCDVIVSKRKSTIRLSRVELYDRNKKVVSHLKKKKLRTPHKVWISRQICDSTWEMMT